MKKTLLLGLCTLTSTLALAQTTHDGAITLTPAVITLRGTYGQTTTQHLTLTNGTSRDLTFEIFARDIAVRGGHRVFVAPGQIDGSIAATAIFSRNQMSLRSGESKSVDVTFTVPPATKCRAVLALFRTTQPIRKGAMVMVPSVGTLLTFRLSDDVVAEGGDVSVRTQSAAANASFAETYINTGAEPVVAKGLVAILDSRGALVGKSAMPSHRLLPAERVEMKSEFPGELPPGRYRVVITVDLEGKTQTHDAEMVVR